MTILLGDTNGKFVHGQRTRTHRTRAYTAWVNMRQRCNNPKATNYSNYGGRGITVCKRWDSFEKFYEDMGDPPARMSLERENNDNGYGPGNCIWATYSDQIKNQRKRKRK